MRHFHWKHKNIIFFVLGLLAAFIISVNPWFKTLILDVDKIGYLGAFLAGMLFTSTFTLPIASLIIINLANSFPVFPLVVFAGLGAVTSDFLIFKFVKDDVVSEITPIYEELEKLDKKNHLRKLIHTRYFGWTLPVIGALIIISPLPDELGVSLLGISNIKTTRFLLISACSHSLGMFLIVSAAALV